jgi:hypothetical protein
VAALQAMQEKFLKDKEDYIQKNEQLRKELNRLESENFLLQQKIRHEKEKMEIINSDNARVTFNMEIFSERKFNHSPAVSSSISEYNSRRRNCAFLNRSASRTRSSLLPPAAHRSSSSSSSSSSNNLLQKQQESTISSLPLGTISPSSPEISPRSSSSGSPSLSPRISPRPNPGLQPRSSPYKYVASSPLRNPFEDSNEPFKKLDLPSPNKVTPQQPSPRAFQSKIKLNVLNKLSPRENTSSSSAPNNSSNQPSNE